MILLILALLPMHMPRGICICHVMEQFATERTCAELDQSIEACDCQHEHSETGDEQPLRKFASSTDRHDCNCGQAPEFVVRTASSTSLLSGGVDSLDLISIAVKAPFDGNAGFVLAHPPPIVPSVESVPRYISFCTFLI